MTEARLMQLEQRLRIPLLLTLLFLTQLCFNQLYGLMLMTRLYEGTFFRISPIMNRLALATALIAAHLLADRLCLRMLRAWKRLSLRLVLMAAAILLTIVLPAAFFEIILFLCGGYLLITRKPKLCKYCKYYNGGWCSAHSFDPPRNYSCQNYKKDIRYYF